MAFDATKAFRDTQREFVAKRGGDRPSPYLKHEKTGLPLMDIFKGAVLIPRTTWADVHKFYTAFIDKTMKFDSWNMEARFNYTPQNVLDRELWRKYSPQMINPSKINSNELYPYNQEFWGYGYKYALMRSSLNAVPSSWSYFVEAVKEAAAELPLPGAPNIGAGISSLENIVKWSVVGGILFLAYKLIGDKK